MSSVEEQIVEESKQAASSGVKVPKELVRKIHADLGKENKYAQKDIQRICECMMRNIVAMVQEGKSVTFQNTLTFKRAYRKDRVHKNPKTGQEIFKKEHYVMVVDVKTHLKKQFEEIAVDPKDRDAQDGAQDGVEAATEE
jgi:nucleoid DNA-binding protein